jgi:hypothetical protein
MRGKCDYKEGELNLAHLFPRVMGYKTCSGIKGGDIMKVRM